jgi:hypothetical protein
MPKKEEAQKNTNILVATGLNGLAITGINAWRVGIVDVIEIKTSTITVFIKIRSGQFDIGGDANWGTGTMS